MSSPLFTADERLKLSTGSREAPKQCGSACFALDDCFAVRRWKKGYEGSGTAGILMHPSALVQMD
jgi:hypothetical protein